jgi:hypothetical protein
MWRKRKVCQQSGVFSHNTLIAGIDILITGTPLRCLMPVPLFLVTSLYVPVQAWNQCYG